MDRYEIETKRLFDQYGDEVDDLLSGKRVFPVIQEIHPGSICNNKCVFCFSDSFEYAKSEDQEPLNLLEVCGYLNQLKAGGTKEVWFSGGKEPLMNKFTPSMIEWAVNLGFVTKLYTNGCLMNDDVIAKINGCSQVRISMNAGTERTYSRLCGANRSFYEAWDNISKIVRKRNSTGTNTKICVSFLLLKENYNELERFVYLAAHYEVDEVHIRKDTVNKMPIFSQKEVDEIREMRERFPDDIVVDFRGLEEGELETDELLPKMEKPELCRAGIFKRGMNPFGKVFHCELCSHPFFNGKNAHLVIGDARIDSLETIYRRASGKYPQLCEVCQPHEVGINIALERYINK